MQTVYVMLPGRLRIVAHAEGGSHVEANVQGVGWCAADDSDDYDVFDVRQALTAAARQLADCAEKWACLGGAA